MKIINHPTILLLILFCLFISCKNSNESRPIKNSDSEIKGQTTKIINIVTRAMEFQMVDTIPSGWNTFKYENLSNETHFVVFEKYPEGITVDSTKAQVFPVFEEGMDLINQGKTEVGFATFNNLPAWFFNVEFYGGVGLVSPKETAVSTLKLESGRYLVECYMKMKNGKFHSVMGMYKEIIVSDKFSGVTEPKFTVTVDLSTENGIVFNPDIRTGEHTFKVNFIDQKVHENFVGHDVNLVRLSKNANITELEAWMNWSNPNGFIDPAPSHVTFLGGMQDMAASKSGYFTANLKQGKYALISEVPNSKSKGLFKEFEVID